MMRWKVLIMFLNLRSSVIMLLYCTMAEKNITDTLPRIPQKVCRRLVEKGADLVVCQHSHCIGAQEEWRKGKIVYGQGNFLFDHSESEYWQTGLLIELSLEKNNNEIETDIIYHPLVKCKNTVRLAEREKAQQILAEFEERIKKYSGFRTSSDRVLQICRKNVGGIFDCILRFIAQKISFSSD